MSETIALLHAGAMGTAIGACALDAGHRVGCVAAGRSRATRERARAAGFDEHDTLEALLSGARVVIAVCPPAAALATAERVVGTGFTGCYVDANAVAPATAARIGALCGTGGCDYVDAGIVGPPPSAAGTTRLYVSGRHARRIAALFTGTRVVAIDLGSDTTAASALKMCYAAWTKGSSALLLATAAAARAAGGRHGADGRMVALRCRISRTRSRRTARRDAPKAWRFAGEMREIAQTFGALGLPVGFHESAADVFEALAAFRDADPRAGNRRSNARRKRLTIRGGAPSGGYKSRHAATRTPASVSCCPP